VMMSNGTTVRDSKMRGFAWLTDYLFDVDSLVCLVWNSWQRSTERLSLLYRARTWKPTFWTLAVNSTRKYIAKQAAKWLMLCFVYRLLMEHFKKFSVTPTGGLLVTK
jgi:hypothetical protein